MSTLQSFQKNTCFSKKVTYVHTAIAFVNKKNGKNRGDFLTLVSLFLQGRNLFLKALFWKKMHMDREEGVISKGGKSSGALVATPSIVITAYMRFSVDSIF